MSLNRRILSRLDANLATGGHSALASLVHLQRAYLAALNQGDAALADCYLGQLRDAVSERPVETAGSHGDSDPAWQDKVWRRIDRSHRWRRGLRTLVAVAVVALLVAASVTAIAMRLRATDAEVQLERCRHD